VIHGLVDGRDRDRTGAPLPAKKVKIQSKPLLRLRLSMLDRSCAAPNMLQNFGKEKMQRSLDAFVDMFQANMPEKRHDTN
jgi:hypothetical protein